MLITNHGILLSTQELPTICIYDTKRFKSTSSILLLQSVNIFPLISVMKFNFMQLPLPSVCINILPLISVIYYGLLLTETAVVLGLRLLVIWLETTNQKRAINEKPEAEGHEQMWLLRISNDILRLTRLGSFCFFFVLSLLVNFLLLF